MIIAPSTTWHDTASSLVDRATRSLFSPIGKEAQYYLHSLGLTDDTIKHFHLGYLPNLEHFSFSEWDIDPSTLTQKQRAKGGINVPDGILIPWFVDGEIQKISVLRPGQSPEYGCIVGSQDCLFNGDALTYDKPALLVTDEIEAMKIWQESGDIIVPVAAKRIVAQHIADLSLSSAIFADKQEYADLLPHCIISNQIFSNDFIQSAISSVWYEQEIPLQGNDTQTTDPENKPSESLPTRHYSQSEIIDQFKASFPDWNVTLNPPGYTLSQHIANLQAQKNENQSQKSYWQRTEEKLERSGYTALFKQDEARLLAQYGRRKAII